TIPNPLVGRGYEWMVTGGEIVSSSDSSSVEVSWNISGITGTLSYMVYSIVDQSCAGTSDILEISVAQEFIISAESSDVRCFGDATGKLVLDIQGGVAPYKFAWSHTPDLNSAIAENLEVGFYSVTVTDQLGCERKLENMEIAEPPLLEVTSLHATGVSCYGKKDGVLDLTVIGGVGPYTIELNGEREFLGQLNLIDVPQGD